MAQKLMPTAAKLFAAAGMAIVGFACAEVYKPYAPEGTQFGYFSIVNAGLGALVGWRALGPDLGRGYRAAISAGLRASMVLLFAALVVFSFEHMLELALRRTYHGPMEALIDVISIGIEYLREVLLLDVLGTLFGGSILAGWFGEWASHRWP